MELRHIRYFLAVAEARNFSRAAERVGIGQPPLSLQIRDLEREVGARLFHRIPQGAELTAAGQAFYDIVSRMPALAEDAIRSARRAARGELGSLRIGFTASSAFNPVVAAAIRNFRRAYPDVELGLEENNSTRLLAGLREGILDAVFLRPEAGSSSSGGDLRLRLLSEEPLLAVLPDKHPAARSAELRLKALRNEPFILFPREAGITLFDTVIATCRKAGFEPRIGQQAPQIASIMQLVAAELGVSLVPASMRQVQVKGIVFKELSDVTATARLSLAWRRTDTSPFLKNFIVCTLN